MQMRVAGWVIGVMLTPEGETAPVRLFYAVAKPDEHRAEWAALDLAGPMGRVASSPFKGFEPVEAIGPISNLTARQMGLADGAVKPLGRRWPRRWLGPPDVPASADEA